METNYNYSTLLSIISNNMNQHDKQFVDENKDVIIEKLSELSRYITDFIKVFAKNNVNNAYKQLSKKYKKILSNKEVKDILDIIQLKNLKGGELEKLNDMEKKIDDTTMNICLNNLPLIFIKFLDPKIFFFVISNLFEYLSEMFTFKINWFDYTKELDWIYLLLFLLASIPIAGGFANLIIIFKALKDERFYLAMVTSITTLISTIFTLNVIDFGVLFKIFYYLDNKSYAREMKRIEGGESEYKNDLNQVVTFYNKEGNNNDFGRIHSQVLKAYLGEKDISKEELQKLDATLSNEEVMKQIMDNNPDAMDDPEKSKELLDAIQENKDIAEAIKKGDTETAIKLLEETKKKNKLNIPVEGINSLREKIEKNQYLE
tara:strand:+ start:4081 stop:5202 length:1122 start_codon:yes stop_codon:yes gene_type:complete